MADSIPVGELAGTARTASGARRRAAVTPFVCALAVIQAGLFFWYLRASIIRTPFWDMYSWILHYLDYRADGGWWSYLWAQHDVHRPVWIRLLTAIDVEAFGGVSYPFIVVTTVLYLLCVAMLWRESRRGLHGDVGLALSGLLLMFVLSATAAVDAGIPIENGYLHVLAFATLAILLFDGDGESTPATAARRRVASLLLAIGASLASGVGFVVWPILAWTAWRSAGRRWLAIVLASGAAFVAIYVYGMTVALAVTPDHVTQGFAEDLIARVNYLLTFLGLPLTRAGALAIPGRMLGAVLLAAGLWAVVWRGLLRPPTSRLERIAVALIMFSLGAAVMASVGRTGVVEQDGVLVPVRYSVLVTPLYIGLLWLVAPLLERHWRTSTSGRATVAAGLMAASVLLLMLQVAVGQAAAARTREMRETIARFVAGQTDAAMLNVIYVDLDQARREWEIIRGAGLYRDAD